MTGAIQNFLNENKITTEKTNNNQGMINIAVRITSYEGKFFVGHRLDTKEEIKIILRDVQQKNASNQRVEIEEYSNPKNYKRYVEPNHKDSILLFDGCYQEKDGTWSSRWANMLSKPSKPATVLVKDASINIIKKSDNEFVSVSILKENKVINNVDDFYSSLILGLTAKTPKARPSVTFRFKDDQGGVFSKTFYSKVDENKVVLDPNLYVNNEIWNKEEVQNLISLLNNPTVKTDCFFMTGFLLGADTNTRVINNTFEKELIKKDYMLFEEGKPYPKQLFKKTIIAMRQREDQSFFIISAKPIEAGKQGLDIENI